MSAVQLTKATGLVAASAFFVLGYLAPIVLFFAPSFAAASSQPAADRLEGIVAIAFLAALTLGGAVPVSLLHIWRHENHYSVRAAVLGAITLASVVVLTWLSGSIVPLSRFFQHPFAFFPVIGAISSLVALFGCATAKWARPNNALQRTRYARR